MSIIIFNADDYGANTVIDNGVIDAIKQKRLNSIAMFANGPHLPLSASRIVDLQKDYNFDIGLHFTITSGKPLSDKMKNENNSGRGESYFVNKYGNFRNYLRMKRAGTLSHATRMSQKNLVKNELNAQIKALRDQNIVVKHISSHHNTLFFFPEYLEALFEVIRDDHNIVPIKVRSVFLQPSLKSLLYPNLIGFASLFSAGMDAVDTVKLIHFNRVIVKWVEDYGKRGNSVPIMPYAVDSSHYGPPPVAAKGINARKRIAKKKAEGFIETVRDYNYKKKDVEFLFHLIDPEIFKGIKKLSRAKRQEYKAKYKGVTPKYFDRRAIEFEALGIFIEAKHQIEKTTFTLTNNPWNQIK